MRLAYLGAGALALVAAASCGIGIGRDLRSVPPKDVIYDDMCKVQEYFDLLETKQARPPAVVSSREVEKEGDKHPAGGLTTFAFEDKAQLQLLHRMLEENWAKVPDKLYNASRVEIEVKWAEKAGVRRVVTTEDALISYDGNTAYLPSHICLSEVLFGAPLYRTRRAMLGLPEPLPPLTVDGGASPDAQSID